MGFLYLIENWGRGNLKEFLDKIVYSGQSKSNSLQAAPNLP